MQELDKLNRLTESHGALRPGKVLAVKPGEWRLAQSLPATCRDAGVVWAERPDRHYYCDADDFEAFPADPGRGLGRGW